MIYNSLKNKPYWGLEHYTLIYCIDLLLRLQIFHYRLNQLHRGIFTLVPLKCEPSSMLEGPFCLIPLELSRLNDVCAAGSVAKRSLACSLNSGRCTKPRLHRIESMVLVRSWTDLTDVADFILIGPIIQSRRGWLSLEKGENKYFIVDCPMRHQIQERKIYFFRLSILKELEDRFNKIPCFRSSLLLIKIWLYRILTAVHS